MIPQRLSAKYFVTDPASMDLPTLIPVFHSWIRENRVDDLLIDVVDYKHVHHGPGIVLVGHKADYALDMGYGRPGFLVTLKRSQFASLKEALRALLVKAVAGSHLIQSDISIQPKIDIGTDDVVISFHDRLRFPNREETLARIRGDLDEIIREVYGDVELSVDWVARDPRQSLALRIRLPEASTFPDLMERLSVHSDRYEESRGHVIESL